MIDYGSRPSKIPGLFKFKLVPVPLEYGINRPHAVYEATEQACACEHQLHGWDPSAMLVVGAIWVF